MIRLLGRLLWSTLCWPCTKSECQELPGHPNMAKVSLYPPPLKKIKSEFEFRTSGLQSPTLPPSSPGKEKWSFWVELQFRTSDLQSTTSHPTPWKSKVVIFGQNFSSGLQICEVSLYPPPPHHQMKSGHFWADLEIRIFRFGKCHFTIPHPQWKWKVVIFGQIFKLGPQICKVPLKSSVQKIKSSHFLNFWAEFQFRTSKLLLYPPPQPSWKWKVVILNKSSGYGLSQYVEACIHKKKYEMKW